MPSFPSVPECDVSRKDQGKAGYDRVCNVHDLESCRTKQILHTALSRKYSTSSGTETFYHSIHPFIGVKWLPRSVNTKKSTIDGGFLFLKTSFPCTVRQASGIRYSSRRAVRPPCIRLRLCSPTGRGSTSSFPPSAGNPYRACSRRNTSYGWS